MNLLVRTSIKRPRLVVITWLILVAACVPLMLQLTGALKAGGFDNPRGPAAKGQTLVDNAFKLPPNTLQVVLHNPAGDVRNAVAAAERVGRATPHVTSVADYRQNPKWLSENKHTTFVQLSFRVDETTIQGEIKGLRERLSASVAGSSVQVHVTGAEALDYDLTAQSTKDVSNAELIAFPLLFIVLLLVFRSVIAMLLPLVVAGAALVVAMAIGYLITRVTDVSVLFENAVSLIGLAVSVDYSLFIIRRYREELANGADYVAALQTATRTAGRSVLFSGLAVVIALLSLFIPRLLVFSSMGVAGIVVALITLVISMTLLPAMLRLLGHRINWATIPLGAKRAARDPAAGRRSLTDLIAALYQRPVPVLLVLLALFTVMSLPIGSIRLQTAVADASILPSSADSRQGLEQLRADLSFSDLFPVQVVLTSPLGAGPAKLLSASRAAARLAGAQADVQTVQSVTSLGLPSPALSAATAGSTGALPAPARAAFTQLWTTYQGSYVSQIVVIPRQGPGSVATHKLVRALRARLPGVSPPGVTALVTGYTAAGVDFDNVLVASLKWILLAVALVTFALLAWAFRSWLLPVVALVLNSMVVGASLGLLTFIAQDVLGQQVDSITPPLIFAVMFGLSMDYMVIMVSRMREAYLELGDHRAAVRQGMARTAGLVNSAALIMVAVFASFLVAKVSVVQQLGLGLGIAIILDAVIIRLLVMPAVLDLLGPRVWGRSARPREAPRAPRAPRAAGDPQESPDRSLGRSSTLPQSD
jgi:RND superfamily putative drug exporter